MAQLTVKPVTQEFAWTETLDDCGSHRGHWSSAKLSFAAWEWIQLDTRLGLNTATETEGCQFEDRGCRTEVINSCSDQDIGPGGNKTQQAGIGAQCDGRALGETWNQKRCMVVFFCLVRKLQDTLWVYFHWFITLKSKRAFFKMVSSYLPRKSSVVTLVSRSHLNRQVTWHPYTNGVSV